MKGAILEVLLVSAQGINHNNIIGNPTYHVIIECGDKVCRSKTSEGNDDKIYWNEKFAFELGSSELENLSHLKLKIMDKEYFIDGGFVGETIIHLKGIIVEGNCRGLIELSPVPFNVVLEDDTYEGQMKIGLKFIPNNRGISPEVQEMDSILNSDENYEMGYHPSPSYLDQTDQSPTETPSYSILSRDSFAYCRTNSETSAFTEHTDDNNYSEIASPICWPGTKSPTRAALSRLGMTMSQHRHCLDEKNPDEVSTDVELELMKEKFSKMLLGEDMSGGGKGVCTAVTISNAITNLYASVFGQHLKLEPLHPVKKSMWKREMNCLLLVCDYIVEFTPTSQNLKDGTILEVMSSQPRLDIHINLPALKKLDAMLLEVLDNFEGTEFWYAEGGSMSGNLTRSGSLRDIVRPHGKEEKWWLPVPCVSPAGLSEKSKKHLRQKRSCTNQIHKAAMAINNCILAEMEIPESYMASLPKSGKASIGDTIYRYMYTADNFSPDHLLDSLNITSEHEALELADKVEASMHTWRRKACLAHSKSSWDMVKDLVSDIDRSDKNHLLAKRAESLLFYLKQRYPELSQTTLDTCKIQYNKASSYLIQIHLGIYAMSKKYLKFTSLQDVGQAVLESYSRVLEGLAYNIVARIEDILFADKSVKNQD
ncbi:unnamed protein product [Fraxinus pennsylvanica]|uniref:Rop guanine nucleotide exchange factor n=1 Tax=Fraxinus pennsylvanica TaxID=56036 RepID=A0AAD1ZIP2_9LAMI|nr:unnamed protein product [Fraxinus pennsylvanica]